MIGCGQGPILSPSCTSSTKLLTILAEIKRFPLFSFKQLRETPENSYELLFSANMKSLGILGTMGLRLSTSNILELLFRNHQALQTAPSEIDHKSHLKLYLGQVFICYCKSKLKNFCIWLQREHWKTIASIPD